MSKMLSITLTSLVVLSAAIMLVGCSNNQEKTDAYHEMYPLVRTDGIPSHDWEGYITEGPVKLDEYFAMVRVQVDPRPDSGYASEYGAIIALAEQPQVGDRVFMETHEVYYNTLSHVTFVRIAHKMK